MAEALAASDSPEVFASSFSRSAQMIPLALRYTLRLVQSNKVHLLQEVLLVSARLAWRQINAIRQASQHVVLSFRQSQSDRH